MSKNPRAREMIIIQIRRGVGPVGGWESSGRSHRKGFPSKIHQLGGQALESLSKGLSELVCILGRSLQSEGGSLRNSLRVRWRWHGLEGWPQKW